MSVNRNVDSVNNKQGEFHPSVPRSEPLTTKGVSYQSPIPSQTKEHIEV